MILLKLWVLSVLAGLALCDEKFKYAEKNERSQSSQSSHDCYRDLPRLQEQVRKLEERLSIMETVLLSSNLNEQQKQEMVLNLQDKAIEDDVQQNKEDIIDLRINDGRHDMLISQGMLMTNYINNTIIPDMKQRFDAKVDELVEYDSYIDSTRPPIGSIIAWLPSYSAKADIPNGWQRCDGSEIKKGPMSGKKTPDLNNVKRFLRGSSDADSGSFEEDSVQDHLHADPGHKHTDGGHTHTDSGHHHYEDSEHFQHFCGSDEAHHSDTLCSRSEHENCGGWYMKLTSWTTEEGRASITAAAANIQTATSGIGGMSSGRVAEETRPKNMNVVYIIRIL